MSNFGTSSLEFHESQNFVHGQGWYLTRTYTGTDADVRAVIPSLVTAGWEVNLSDDAPHTRLTATKQAMSETEDQEFYDRFTVTKETVQKDVWELPAVQDEIENVWEQTTGSPGAEYRALIEEAISLCDSDLLPGVATYPVAHKLFTELGRGVTNYEDEYVVLTRERVVGIKYGSKLPLRQKNTALIYTFAEMSSQFNLPSLVGVTFPSAPAIAPANTLWGWRSRKHEIQFIDGQKAEVVQDWALASWSTFLYEEFSP